MRKLPLLFNYSERCKKRQAESRRSDQLSVYSSISKVDFVRSVGRYGNIQNGMREKARKASEDLADQREKFLRESIRLIWQRPKMMKIAARFLTLKIHSSTTNTDESHVTMHEKLSIDCDPPSLRKLFLKDYRGLKKAENRHSESDEDRVGWLFAIPIVLVLYGFVL